MNDLFNQLNALHGRNEQIRDRNVIRSPFAYPGGKDKICRQIIDLLPVRDIFVDVCGGSGVITINREPSRVLDVYNDRWSGVTSFFQCLRDPDKYKLLVDMINMSVHSREDFLYCKENYANMNHDVVLRACMFYIMMSKSFACMGRNWARSVNSKTSFYKSIELDHWRMLHTIFSRVQVENLDWEACLADYDGPNSVFYIDPPYPGTFQAIYKHKFTDEMHEKMCKKIFTTKGFVAISSYANPIYDAFPWDEKHSWDVNVTCDSKSSTDTGNRIYQGGENLRTTEVLYIKESI